MPNKIDSQDYLRKKAFFEQLLTVYGRKPVLEILQDTSIPVYKLHLASSNKTAGIINDIIKIANDRKIAIDYHSRQELSRISKNSKQDQGVCVDIECPLHQSANTLLSTINPLKTLRLLAVDNITNPQNLGMIIRSACAGGMDGILMSKQGNAKLDSLVIKASAGTLFKFSIFFCQSLENTLKQFKDQGVDIIGLSGNSELTLKNYNESNDVIYILGNESTGVSKPVLKTCSKVVSIPMSNGVESLNVAVTASLLAFKNNI